MKYRKKPVVIEAVRVEATEKSMHEILEFMNQKVDTKCNIALLKFWEYCEHVFSNGLTIATKEGDMRAFPGDYIVKGVQGEFFPCKPDIFEQTYELCLEH